VQTNKEEWRDETTPYYDNLLERAAIIYDSGDTLKAFHFLDSITPLYKEASEIDKFRRFNYYADMYTTRIKDYYNAMIYADSMLTLAEENATNGMTTELAHANYIKGDIHFALGDYDKAYDYYYKARSISKDNGDTCIMAYYAYRMGMMLYKQKQFRNAITNFKQTLQEGHVCQKDFNFFYRNQEVIDNIGLCFSQIGEYDSSIAYYLEALSYIDEGCADYLARRENGCEKAKGVIYGNMGASYFNKKEYALAEKWFKISIEINSRKGNDLLDAQYTSIKLAETYFIEGKYDDMRDVLMKVQNVLNFLHDKEAEMRWQKLMWKYYVQVKQPAQALEYLTRYSGLKDSITDNIEALRGIDVDQRVRTRDNEYLIGLLKKQNELRETYLTLSVLIAVLSIVIVLLIYQNFKRTRKNVDLLTALNKQIKLQKLELENANDEKDRILKAAAHDLRGPIASVMALSELILTASGTINEEQEQYLSLIKEACVNAMDLSKDILEAASSLRKENLKIEKIDFLQLLGNTVELMRPKAVEKNQRITIQVPPENLQLFIDKAKMSRVIVNLISNAIKFSPSGSIIKVILEKNGDTLQLSVHDNGIGIPDNLKAKIFDVFTEAKRQGTYGEKSFGLGLSIAKHIVEAHEGRIRLESEKDMGTTFYITLDINNKRESKGN